MAGDVRIKRVYDEAEAGDGYRVLIDRLWPRGISKDNARLDEWARDLAPSNELRKWFGHEPERFAEFRRRYREELDANPATEALLDAAGDAPVLLLYDAKDTEHNQAVVLADWLRDRRGTRHR